jgi:sodium-coupled neutral amino acid transporter 11
MAVSGYLVFTSKTEGNILNNFPADDLMVNIARFCFGANMSTTGERRDLDLWVRESMWQRR